MVTEKYLCTAIVDIEECVAQDKGLLEMYYASFCLTKHGAK